MTITQTRRRIFAVPTTTLKISNYTDQIMWLVRSDNPSGTWITGPREALVQDICSEAAAADLGHDLVENAGDPYAGLHAPAVQHQRRHRGSPEAQAAQQPAVEPLRQVDPRVLDPLAPEHQLGRERGMRRGDAVQTHLHRLAKSTA